MPWPTVADWTRAGLALGLTQLAVVARFGWRLRRDRTPPPSGSLPAAAVVIPCKGAGPRLAEHVDSLRRQRYGAPLEILFVVADETDPAHVALAALLAERPDPRLRLLCSAARPRRCSEQILNLLFGVERAEPRPEVLLFADSDLIVEEDWAARLVAPLADPRAGVSTAAMLYVPERPGFWSFLRMVWEAVGLPYFALMGCVAGHSFAVRRRDFEDWRVAEVWSRRLSHDLSLAALARARGLEVRWASAAVPVNREGCDGAAFFGMFNKWMVLFKFYDRRVWALGLATTALKLAILARALWPRPSLPLLALVLGMDAAEIWLVFVLLRRYLPSRFRGMAPAYRGLPWRAALAAPALLAAYAVNFAVSLPSRTIRWGGYLYRLRAAEDIEAIAPADARS